MRFLLNIALGCLCIALVYAALPLAYAASIEATPRKGYGRVNFTFEQPAKLQANSSDNKATLTFDKPLEQSPDAIIRALPNYVDSAVLSADNRTLTLTLNKPMRVRQFTSGNTVGIDLIEAAPRAETAKTEKPAEPKSAAADPMLSTKKPAEATPAKPEPKKETPAKTQTTAATKKPTTPEKPKADAMLTTKKPAAPEAKPEPKKEPAKTAPKEKEKPAATETASTKPAAAEPAKAEAKPAATEEAMLSTKAPAAAEPAPTAESITTTKTAEAPAEAKPQEAPAEKTAEPAPAPAAAEKPAAADTGPFVVSTRTNNGETIIQFPWKERTAAAVFKRSRDIWIVFSRPADANTGLLRTVLPKTVISATQYNYPGNTVLHLATDGSINAKAKQAAKGYAWDIALSAAAERPPLDVSFSPDSLEGTMRMIMGIFDVAPELRFYDPSAGEQLIVVPSFEAGRAVANERNFPEFTALASSQGVALVARDTDLSLNQTRSGLIISSKKGLSVSESLPQLAGTAPVVGTSVNSGVMMPYEQWYVPREKYMDTLFERLANVTAATKSTKADSLMELVKLYLADGWGIETLGVLNLLRDDFPEYYAANRLALLSAVSNFMTGHMDKAATDLLAPELTGLEEAQLWQQVVTLYAPPVSPAQKIQQTIDEATPKPATTTGDSAGNTGAVPVADASTYTAKPVFQFLKFNKSYIRFYPPRIRQRLAVMAGDAYIEDGQEEKAMAVYDTLIRDGISEPIKMDAEFALGATAQKKGEYDQAYEIYDRLTKNKTSRRIAARARVSAALLRYHQNKLTADEASEILESTRLTWRGDAVERKILTNLITLYTDSKRYGDVLRSQKALVDAFPTDADVLTLSGNMSELFERIFLEDLGDEMPPLNALSLFYEFRELTPLGEKGDKIIQRLADRLAAIDLLDRSIQLLENQIKFRASGESRSRIGARLALLHIFNKHPQEAVDVLETTNFGGNTPELQLMRRQLAAQALSMLGKHEEALGVIYNDRTATGAQLRLDILWAMKDWPNIINRAEDILSARPNLTEALTNGETETLLKLALAYTFESDYNQLRYLRDYYAELIPDTAYKQIFDFITNDTNPLDPEDFNMLAQQISRTEGFLSTFKAKIAAGKLSEAIK